MPLLHPNYPSAQMTTAGKIIGDDYSKDTFHSCNKNLAPCANCSSSQQACNTQPPYSPTLCRKCARENRDKCPPHMQRVDALIWKKQDRELRRPFIAYAEGPDTGAPLSKAEVFPTDRSVVNATNVEPSVALSLVVENAPSIPNNHHCDEYVYVPSALRTTADEYFHLINNGVTLGNQSTDQHVLNIEDASNSNFDRMNALIREWNELKAKQWLYNLK